MFQLNARNKCISVYKLVKFWYQYMCLSLPIIEKCHDVIGSDVFRSLSYTPSIGSDGPHMNDGLTTPLTLVFDKVTFGWST